MKNSFSSYDDTALVYIKVWNWPEPYILYTWCTPKCIGSFKWFKC